MRGDHKKKFMLNAQHPEITKLAKDWGVKIPYALSRYDNRQRAQMLVTGIRNLKPKQVLERRDRINDLIHVARQSRTDEEARQAVLAQGRARNEHGRIAPTSSSGIIPVVNRQLPPDMTESNVHAPASGARQIIQPTPAISTDQHGRAAPLPPSSAPKPVPSPSRIAPGVEPGEIHEDVPRGTTLHEEMRRREAMRRETPNRMRREGIKYGTETREMVGLETGSDTESEYGGPTPYGHHDDSHTDTQGETSVSRSHSRAASRSESAVRHIPLVDIRSPSHGPRVPRSPSFAPSPSQDYDPFREEPPDPFYSTEPIDLRGPDTRSRTRSPESTDVEILNPEREPSDVEARSALRGGTQSSDESGGHTPDPRAGLDEAGRDEAARALITKDPNAPVRRGTRNRLRPDQYRTQLERTPDRARRPDYTGATEGLSGVEAIHMDWPSSGSEVDISGRPPNSNDRRTTRTHRYAQMGPTHRWTNRHGRWIIDERGHHSFTSAGTLQADGQTYDEHAYRWGGPDVHRAHALQQMPSHHPVMDAPARFSGAVQPSPRVRRAIIGPHGPVYDIPPSPALSLQPRPPIWLRQPDETSREYGARRQGLLARDTIRLSHHHGRGGRGTARMFSPPPRESQSAATWDKTYHPGTAYGPAAGYGPGSSGHPSFSQPPERNLYEPAAMSATQRESLTHALRRQHARDQGRYAQVLSPMAFLEHGTTGMTAGQDRGPHRRSRSRSVDSDHFFDSGGYRLQQEQDEKKEEYDPLYADELPEEDWGPEPADEIPEADADIPGADIPGFRRMRVQPLRRRPVAPRPGAPGVRPYSRRQVSARTSIGTTVGRVHGPFRGSLSTMPKLSWQHLAPGHYVAKARQGMTPGIRQHVLKLLKRAKGYIWVNGKRMKVSSARTVILNILSTRASVDIKLSNEFPYPPGGRSGLQ